MLSKVAKRASQELPTAQAKKTVQIIGIEIQKAPK